MLISCSICFLHTPSHFYPTSTALFRLPDSFSFSPLDPLPLVGRLLYKALYAYSCSLGTRLVMLFFPFRSATLCAPVDGILFPLFPTSSCRVLSPFDYDLLISYSPDQIPATTVFVSICTRLQLLSSRLLLFFVSVASPRLGKILICIFCRRFETSNGRPNLYASRASPS